MFDVFDPRTAHHSRPHVSFARFHSDTPPSSYPTTSVSPAPSNAAQTATGFLFFSEPVPFAAASAPERAGGAPSTDGSARRRAASSYTSNALRRAAGVTRGRDRDESRETPGDAGPRGERNRQRRRQRAARSLAIARNETTRRRERYTRFFSRFLACCGRAWTRRRLFYKRAPRRTGTSRTPPRRPPPWRTARTPRARFPSRDSRAGTRSAARRTPRTKPRARLKRRSRVSGLTGPALTGPSRRHADRAIRP